MAELLRMLDLHTSKTGVKVKSALSAFVGANIEEWIVDSGASDHMTGNSTLFSTYSPCPGNYKVSIANGERAVVAGQGTIKISNAFMLEKCVTCPSTFC